VSVSVSVSVSAPWNASLTIRCGSKKHEAHRSDGETARLSIISLLIIITTFYSADSEALSMRDVHDAVAHNSTSSPILTGILTGLGKVTGIEFRLEFGMLVYRIQGPDLQNILRFIVRLS